MGVWAYGLLDALGKGEKIFPFLEAMEADLPENGFENVNDWNNLALISDVARRYFGTRGKYYRPLGMTGGTGCGGGCD
jgi:hypothetical protein